VFNKLLSKPCYHLATIVTVSLILFLAVFSGCDNIESENPGFENQFEDVGIEHNEGLEKILSDVKRYERIRDKSRSEVYQIIEESAQEFSGQIGSAPSPSVRIGVDISLSGERMNASPKSAGSWVSALPDSLSEKLSEKQVDLISQVMTALDETDSVEELGSRLSHVEESATRELDESDADVVLMASSTALHSKEYWIENKDDWIEAFSENNTAENSAIISKDEGDGFSTSDVGKSDVAGCVGGAVGGGIVGGGAGAATGCVAVGAGGSATSAAMQVLDMIW
jgi:hypothetical protein